MVVRDSSTLPLILSAPKYFSQVFQLSASFYQRPNIPDAFACDKINDPPFASFSCIIIVKTSRQRITKITAGREMGLVELGKYLIHKK